MNLIATSLHHRVTRAAVALALVCGAASLVIASDSTPAAPTAKVIYLHAPNNATASITVAAPKSTTPTANKSQVATSRNHAKVIELHAPNSPTTSLSLWPKDLETEKIQVAPLK